jgi:hypothetical protein
MSRARAKSIRLVRVSQISALLFLTVVELHAEPLRLRGDALVSSRSPVGLLALQGEDRTRSWVDAEALIWTGSSKEGTGSEPVGDVLVLSLRLREPHGYGELRFGRFIVATGAIRPLHLDGVSGLGRLPWGSTVEVFGGSPVVPRFGERVEELASGGRIAQRISTSGNIGMSYVRRWGHGEVANEEAGADLTFRPLPWMDLAARGAYDLIYPGIADALVSSAFRASDIRLELFASHRSPSRLLPATSLFAVLGSFPSDTLGSTLRWRAFPRLELLASGAGQQVGGEFGGNAWIRSTLWLDDRGDGSLGLELRHQSVVGARWSGVRGIASLPMGAGFRYSTEVEIAVRDAKPWPWGLMALAWHSKNGWELAAAVEASSTPQQLYETRTIARVTKLLEFLP